jgi:hypothetical protein
MAESATRPVIHETGVLDLGECEQLAAVWHAFSPYRPSSDSRSEYRAPVRTRPRDVPVVARSGSGAFEFMTSLRQRFDAGQNFVRTGGRFGRVDVDPVVARARTDYFRETYATRYMTFAPGIEFLLEHQGIAGLADRLFGLPDVVPILVYANLLLPGQELGLHTDVPEFRLAPGVALPPWLRVVMCHSGLFERWRIPIATAIVYLGSTTAGGELAYFADGSDGPASVIAPREGEAVVLDADLTFHGVDRVGGGSAIVPSVTPASRLVHQGDRRWVLGGAGRADGGPVETYDSEALRFSASWKGCCFADEADRMRWEMHTDDLPADQIIGRLRDELEQRGRLTGSSPPSNDELGALLVDEFVRFPPPGSPDT